MKTMPYVEEGNSRVDLVSRLLADNIILISGEVDQDMADLVVGELLYLSSKDPSKPVEMYINSPGGSITAGMAIYDTMKMIPNPVNTTCIGMAASMAAFLLAAGKECGGTRSCTPFAEVMIHQPLGGAQGQSTDVDIRSRNLIRTTLRMLTLKARFTNHTLKEMIENSERDHFMSAQEALEFGMIDEILYAEGEEPLEIPEIPSLNITTVDGLENLIKMDIITEEKLGIKLK